MMGLGKIMKQVAQLQEDLAAVQEELAQLRVEGSAGGGAVVATVSGTGELCDIRISPEAVDPQDLELLQDLVVAAVREAQTRATEQRQARMSELTAGLPIPPGLQIPGLM